MKRKEPCVRMPMHTERLVGSVKSSSTLEVKTPSMHFCVKSHHPQPANPLDHLSGADRHSLHVVSCEQVFTGHREEFAKCHMVHDCSPVRDGFVSVVSHVEWHFPPPPAAAPALHHAQP